MFSYCFSCASPFRLFTTSPIVPSLQEAGPRHSLGVAGVVQRLDLVDELMSLPLVEHVDNLKQRHNDINPHERRRLSDLRVKLVQPEV